MAAVLPGTKVAVGDSLYDVAGVSKMTVQVLPGESEPLEDEPANFTVGKIVTKRQQFGGYKTTGKITSPFIKDLQDLYAAAVYRNKRGDIIGGAFTFVNFVPAKGHAAVELSPLATEMKKPASTEIYVQLSSLSLLSD